VPRVNYDPSSFALALRVRSNTQVVGEVMNANSAVRVEAGGELKGFILELLRL